MLSELLEPHTPSKAPMPNLEFLPFHDYVNRERVPLKTVFH